MLKVKFYINNYKKFIAHLSLMRLILTLLLISNLSSCKTIPNSNESFSAIPLDTECPKDGVCNMEFIKNKTLSIEVDEFGSLYPRIDEGRFTILIFEYKRNEILDTADSGYREIIYMQLDPESLEMELNGKDLLKVNLLFGRLCYCKGSTGYYKITDGHLLITKREKGEYHIELSFKTSEVPQIINRISETFVIK